MLFGKTHASITAGLSQMIDDLDNLADVNAAKAVNQQAEIARIKDAIDLLNEEHALCSTTASNLRKIIGK